MSKERKEAQDRAEHKRAHENDTFEKVAAEHAAEFEAVRKRTEELRQLWLAQEKRGRVRPRPRGARIAKSVTKETLAQWLEEQQKTGRKT